MRRLVLYAGLWLWGIMSVHAQQMPLYNQYMLNGYLINPAVAGSEGLTTLSLTARSQWVGLPNAPNNQAFSIDTRLLKRSYIIKQTSVKKKRLKPSRNGRVGLGGYVFNDLNGSISRTGVHFSYAYHLRIKEGQLSFGLGGTAYQFHIRDLNFLGDEPLVGEGLYEPVFVPDADFGIHWLQPRKYYVGFSIKNLLESYLKLGNRTLEDFRLSRHYYITGGYQFRVGSNLILEPSGLIKFSSQFMPQMDLNMKAIYLKNYWAGISIRTNGSLVTLFGLSVDKYYFGYAFDLELSSIMKRTFGSHEFMISMKIGDTARRYRWLDRY